ncbi:hypothetical protein [Phenylobacterium sp.]|uniref:hypothetical protein n=1 Tax=Phenylobacterium sp. TaxID=1871053 RepID=UPI002F95C77D
MSDGDPEPLCPEALRHVRELVLENGGATEEEAAVLLRAVERLKAIQAERGAEAAEAAALVLRRVWGGGPADR